MSHILVTDDEPSVRSIVARALLSKGHRVTEAANGSEAITAFLAGGVELVLLDMLMPDKDGAETLRALRGIDPGVRVVAMSGGGLASSSLYLRCAKLMGASQILEKPFSAADLFRAVDAALEVGPKAAPTDRDAASGEGAACNGSVMNRNGAI